jgi:hypothetical protein
VCVGVSRVPRACRVVSCRVVCACECGTHPTAG